MPITADNYQRAEDFISRASLDPNFDPARLAKLKGDLETFKSGQSQAVPYRDQSETPTTRMRSAKAGYFYEPSLDEFHSAMRDPQVISAIGSPEVRLSRQGNTSAGASYLESKVPELAALNKTDTEHLTEQSPEYKAYSDYAYQQAKQKDPSVDRYSSLDITQNPFKKSLGAVIKHGPAAALGAEETLGLKIPRRAIATMAGNTPDSAADAQYDPMGAPVGEWHPEKAESVMQSAKDYEELSPVGHTIGQFGAYALPVAPANAVAKGLTGALGYEAANPFMKAVIGGTVGGYTAASEGMVKDVAENPSITQDELANNYLPRLVYGAGGGVLADAAGQFAGKAQQAFEQSPRWSPIKNQRDIGGDTNFLTGIETTPGVKDNVRIGALGRENRTPQDIAAQKVAPGIQQSLDNRLTKTAADINKQVEDYVASPYGMEEQSARPAVDRLLSMADKGTVSMPVSGKYVSANKASADAIRRNLQEFSEFQHVSPEEAQAIAKQHDGVILSSRQADVLGLPNEPGKVHVVVPSKFNAEALLKKEDQIARNLKYDTKEGGVDNPVLQELDKSFKEIRDKFKYDDPNAPKPEAAPFVDRRGPGRPTNEQWQAMQAPVGVNRNTPISENSEVGTVTPEPGQSSVGEFSTEPPPARSEPTPVAEIKGNKRYQEPSASEYAKMQNGESVDKSGNGYQRLLDTEDFAPAYRLRADPAEVDSLTKLAQEADDLEAIYKANPGISAEDAQRSLEAKASLPSGDQYSPEFPASEAEQTGWASPFRRGQDNPFTPDRIAKRRSEWTPNEDLYTANPPESIAAEEYKSVATAPKSEAENRSLFPDTPDQVGVPNKSEMAKAAQTPDVGKVKDIVAKTDEAASKLTPEELDAVHSYTSRKGEKVGSKEWESATKKLTVDKPTEGGTLYHGTRLPQSEIDKILKNKSFSMSKPTSTSYNKDIASAMAHSRAGRGEPVVFHVDDIDNGISLASRKLGIHGTNNEKEILLHNKDFAVTGTSKDSDGNLVINLKQKFNTPEQLKAKLESGQEVQGFSALRRQQHEALTALEEARKGTGGATKEGAHRRALNYKSGEGSPYENAALAQEADALGLRQQLEEIPATREYPGLRARAFAGGGEGPMNTLKDFLGFRLDPVLGAIAGQGRNPYTALPNTPAGRIQQYLFRQGVPFYPLLEGKAGLAGARYADEVADRNRKR